MSGERTISPVNRAGVERIPVEVPTHVSGTLEFHSGALITLVMSFDVHHHTNHPLELHGEHGSLQVPDPNTFGGPVRVRLAGSEAWEEVPLVNGYTENVRGIGAADLASAILTDRPHRCHSDLALHVLDVMQSLHEAAEQGKHITIESRCERPAPLPLGVGSGDLGDTIGASITMTKTALINWGGWDGHEPEACAELFADLLRDKDFEVKVVSDLDVYTDEAYMQSLELNCSKLGR